MNIRTPAAALEGGSLCEAYWYSPEGRPAPSCLPHVMALDAPSQLPFDRPVICLSPFEGEDLGGEIADVRARIGEEAYLICVRSIPPSADHVARAIAAGADDVLVAGDADSMSICCARAMRGTAARRAAAAYRQRYQIERDYLQACIDNLPTPIFYKNSRGVYVGCNRAFAAYIGRSAEEIVGSTVYDIAPFDLATAYDEADRQLLGQGGVQLYEATVNCSTGEVRAVSFHKAVITDGDGNVRGIAGAILDITARKELEMRLKDAAERDPLTNLHNRRKFMEAAPEIVAAATGAGVPATVAVVDVDHFKAVNDGYGHAAGDEVLREIARVLEEGVPSPGIVARAGGEEFFVVLPGHDTGAAAALFDRLRRRIARCRFGTGAASFGVTISIGIAALSRDCCDVWECLKRADEALYAAKNGGRNRLSSAA